LVVYTCKIVVLACMLVTKCLPNCLQEPAAADLLARAACDPADAAASQEDVQSAVQEYERLLGTGSTSSSTAAAAAATAAGGGRQSKRRKASAAAAAAADDDATQQQQQQQQGEAVQLPQEAAVQLYRLYSTYLAQRLQVLSSDEARVMEAAACAQQLFKLMLRAHEAGAADVALYQQWVQLACQLQQHKVGNG
jgi:hypothetical protein